jgi:hypothetical protein
VAALSLFYLLSLSAPLQKEARREGWKPLPAFEQYTLCYLLVGIFLHESLGLLPSPARAVSFKLLDEVSANDGYLLQLHLKCEPF